ncbi:MAG: Rqc2 family fibronectin-binding protein [Anaerotignaceae bacterium]
MALDGITVSAIVDELKKKLLGGRIDKIYQPQKDEIIMSVRSIGENFKLLASANPSHPRLQLTPVSKDNPMTPPLFCMVLRKHIAGSKITNISQPDFERIIVIEMDSLNEMGDMTTKKLIIEIMGKHSNVILVDENNKILDSIKRISHDTSSVREVLPAKDYIAPPSQNKLNPLNLNKGEFLNILEEKSAEKLQQLIYKTYTGISPVMASEICHRARLDGSLHPQEISDIQKENLFDQFFNLFEEVKNHNYIFETIYNNDGRVLDFAPLSMTQYKQLKKVNYTSISEMLDGFYTQRDNAYHIKQKAYDMRKVVSSNIERCVKKKEIQAKTLKDNEGLEKWKLRGELITANIYSIKKGMTTFKTVNYYETDMPEIEITLDPTKTPAENAQKYFNKYNKAKRTLVALKVQMKENEEELDYLEGVLVAIESSTEEMDLKDIRDELMAQGFIKKKGKGKVDKRVKKSKPLHFLSSEGFHIYVGKSNLQNDELTIHFAKANDIWLHTKNIPGSHVIIVTNDTGEVPDKTLLEAANLAAFNSKGKNGSKVPVDYCLRRNVKKPSGSKPGMVIYENNKTIYITPDEIMIDNMENL